MSTFPSGPSPRHPAATPPGEVEDGPLVFRTVRLLVGIIAGLFGVFLVFGALGPQVYGEVVSSVDADLILPDEDEAELPPLRERSYVYAADGSLLAVLHDEEQRVVVDLDDVPDHVWQAILTAEDRRFFEHEGYDVEGIGRAAVANVRARGITQGGSTITQQLAKLNFLDDAQTLDRKFSELLYAIALEEKLDKEYILERYVNQVYFGAGAYGVQAAAEEYWGIEAADLEPQHSALLAAMIRSPGIFDPRGDPDGALDRRNRVLLAMAGEGYLDEDEAEELTEADLDVRDHDPHETLEPYVVEAVKREFLGNPAFGETREERLDALFGGGLELHTTIDPGLQEIAREVVADHYPDEAPTAAIAAVEHDTGAIVALQSGQDFESLQYDLALQGRRQPGSAMKTYVMLEALRQGLGPDTSFSGSSPISIGNWRVTNYGGASYGSIDLRQATRDSVNTYYAQLANRVGVDEIKDLTAELGISSDAYGTFGGLAAVSIGGLDRGITPLEMASAYGVMANGGVLAEPYFLAKVLHDGDEVWTHEAEERRVFDEDVAATAVDILRDVVDSGTGTAAQIEGWDVVGKTGTTNDNYDAWFVGMTPPLSTAVWVGHPQSNIRMAGATGGGFAAPVWRDFMERALEEYEPGSYPEGEIMDDDGDDDNGVIVTSPGDATGGSGNSSGDGPNDAGEPGDSESDAESHTGAGDGGAGNQDGEDANGGGQDGGDEDPEGNGDNGNSGSNGNGGDSGSNGNGNGGDSGSNGNGDSGSNDNGDSGSNDNEGSDEEGDDGEGDDGEGDDGGDADATSSGNGDGGSNGDAGNGSNGNGDSDD